MVDKNHNQSYDWLQKILRGEVLSAHDIEDICNIQDETDFMDFKQYLVEGKKAKHNKTLKKYASAFCNGLGGFLVIGVSEQKVNQKKQRQITGFDNRFYTTDLETHVKNILREVSGFIYPSPKVQVVTVSDVKVGIIAFSRAPGSLVPDMSEKPAAYWMRFGDGCMKLPEYLLNDLKTGNRARPFFTLKSVAGSSVIAGSIRPTSKTFQGPNGSRETERSIFSIFVAQDFENGGFAYGDELESGIIGPSIECDSLSGYRLIPTSLLSYIDTDNLRQEFICHHRLRLDHSTSTKPFTMFTFASGGQFGVSAPTSSRNSNYQSTRIQLCSYIIARNGAMQWFNISIEFCGLQKPKKGIIEGDFGFSPTESPSCFWREYSSKEDESGGRKKRERSRLLVKSDLSNTKNKP